jgi:hypothetical protein
MRWRYFVLSTYVSDEIADYVGDPRADQRIKSGLTDDHYFNPVVSVYSRYEHTDLSPRTTSPRMR